MTQHGGQGDGRNGGIAIFSGRYGCTKARKLLRQMRLHMLQMCSKCRMIGPLFPEVSHPPVMRLVDEYEWVPQMRHYQALFVRYRHAPAVVKTLQDRFGLRRVTESDAMAFSAESALLLSEWLHAQGDPHAMAWIAHAMDLGAGDGAVYYLRAHATLAQALAELTRLAPLFFPDAQFACETVDDELRLSFFPMGMGKRLGVLLRYEAICIWTMRVLDDITGGKAPLLRMEWMNSAQSDEATLQDIVHRMPEIGAPHFRVVYPASALRLHLPGASEMLRTHLAPMYEKRIAGRQRSNSVVRRVAQWLDEQVQLQDPRLDLVAQALAMGASTLRRQLAQEGCSFSDILASHRACIGIHALIHSDEKAEAVALQTGYADRNTFERAFRDWFGITPAHCRRAAKELLGPQRHLDWGAPSKWARHAPRLPWLKQALTQAQPDWQAITQAITNDPVLHTRLLGYLAMPSQGARTLVQITSEQVAELPSYALGNLLDSAAPLIDPGADARCQTAWNTSQRAVAAIRVLGPALGCGALETLQLAAACFNLGELVRPDIADRHVDGVDVGWLLLAGWHVPSAVLHLLRQRHAPEGAASTALGLAVAWAQTGAHRTTDVEGYVLAECPPSVAEQLAQLEMLPIQ